MTILRTLFVVACALCACSAPAPTVPPEQPPVARQPWPHEVSDIAPDPALHFARLPNGFRFVWQHHAQPPGRCSMRLIVHVGSADENEDEHGMAHFVEHMAFNGTPRFPGNSIGEWFKQRGMAGGADVNAFTSPVHTRYVVDVPTNDSVSLHDALDVLREMTTCMTLDAAEVDQEKAVIDAEERERYARPVVRAEEERVRRLLAGRCEVEHTTIGTAADRAMFTSALLRAFHARWYRPDNMTLVLVGDLQDADVPALVAATFAPLAACANPPPPRAARGSPTLADTRFVLVQPDRTDVEFWVFHPAATPVETTTVASAKQQAALYVAADLCRWLLDQVTRTTDPVVTSVSTTTPSEMGLQGLDGIVVRFRCAASRAEEALALVAHQLTSARAQGFSDELVQSARTAFLRAVDGWQLAASGASAADVADRIDDALAIGQVPCAPSEWFAGFRRAWNSADGTSATAVFRAAWSDADPALVAIAPSPLHFDPLAAWRAGCLAPTSPLAEPSLLEVAWPYARSEPGPEPTQRTRDAHLDLEIATFANGVRVLVKHLDAAAGQTRVAVCVGAGFSGLAGRLRAPATLLEETWRGSGLGKLPADELAAVAEASRAVMQLTPLPNAWCMKSVAAPESLGFQLEWLCAQCADPGWSEQAFARAVASAGPQFAKYAAQPAGALDVFAGDLIDCPALPSQDEIAAARLTDLQQLFEFAWREAPITVIVAGDVQPDTVLAHAARTFGTLPPRPSVIPQRLATVERARHEEREIAADAKDSFVAIVAPLETADITEQRASNRILCNLLGERLRTRIREQLGASYAPGVRGYRLGTNPPLMMLRAVMPTALGNERRVLDAALDAIATLRRDGCTAEELEAARKVERNASAARRSSTLEWVGLLAETHGDPDGLERLANWPRALDAVTITDVQRVAARLLRPENLSTLVLRPKKD